MGARTAFWISIKPGREQLRLDISHCRARDKGLDTHIIRYLNFSDTRHYTYFVSSSDRCLFGGPPRACRALHLSRIT